ncbi:MAG: PAS domain S-box protein [Bacteroidia bacterium]
MESNHRRNVFLFDSWSAWVADIAIFLGLIISGNSSYVVYYYLGIPVVLYPLSILFFVKKSPLAGIGFFILTAVFLVVSAAIEMPQIRYESLMMIPIGLSAFLYLSDSKLANGFFFFLCTAGITLLVVELFLENLEPVEGNYILYNQVLILLFFFVIFTKLISLVFLYRRIISDSAINARNLGESEKRYRDLFENVNEGIVQIDEKRRIVASNKAARDLLEISGDYPVRVIDLIYKDDYDIAQHYYEILKRDGQFSDFQGRFITSDGKIRYLEVSSVGIFNETGDLTGSRDIIRDITDVREAELALRQSEVQYRTLFENNLYGIALLDAEARFVDFNQAFLNVMGYSEEEMRAKTVFEITEPDDLPECNQNIHALVTGKIRSFIQEKRYIRKNGKLFHAIAAVNGIYDDLGNFIAGVGTVMDVTERVSKDAIIQKQLLDLNEKNQELEKYITSNLELENFAYIASHDLQAPIRSIISFTQLLKRTMGDKVSEEEEEYLGFILTASRNMYNLIRDLLMLSRVNTTKIRLDKLELGKIIGDIKKELKPVLEENKVSLKIGNCPNVLIGDRTKIYQLFQNLLTNAIKFQSPGINPEIEIFCEERSDDWLFCVSDNGIGIEAEYQDRIFLLFRRLHNDQKYEGTGIGLALCKKIVAQHNGRIWVNSAPGKGSRFYFTISKRIELPVQV